MHTCIPVIPVVTELSYFCISQDQVSGSENSPKVIIIELSISLFYPAVDYIKDKVIEIAKKGAGLFPTV